MDEKLTIEDVQALRDMMRHAEAAEALSDQDLHDAVIREVWSQCETMREDALLSELLDRFEERHLWPAEIEIEGGV